MGTRRGHRRAARREHGHRRPQPGVRGGPAGSRHRRTSPGTDTVAARRAALRTGRRAPAAARGALGTRGRRTDRPAAGDAPPVPAGRLLGRDGRDAAAAPGRGRRGRHHGHVRVGPDRGVQRGRVQPPPEGRGRVPARGSRAVRDVPPGPRSGQGTGPGTRAAPGRPRRARHPHLAAAGPGPPGGTTCRAAACRGPGAVTDRPGAARRGHPQREHDDHSGRCRAQGAGHRPRPGPGGDAGGGDRRAVGDDGTAPRDGTAHHDLRRRRPGRRGGPRAAARPEPAAGAGRPGARQRRAGGTDGARRPGRTPGGRGPGRVPRRAGGADQHRQARRGRPCVGPGGVRARRAAGGRDRQRRPPRPPGPGGGRGLVGLRERLALYGGTLHTGRRPGGGFRVRAVIPVEGP